MVIRNGLIYSVPLSTLYPSLIGQQVYLPNNYVGKIKDYSHSTKRAIVALNDALSTPIEVMSHHLRQIWIYTDERVNDIQPENDGRTRRLLRLDQWEHALDNYVMTGDKVQFGWWKENENDVYTYFQLAFATPAFRFDADWIGIATLARKKNMFGDYAYDTPEDVVEAYNKLKNKKKK